MKKFWSYQEHMGHTDLYILTEIASEESWWSDVTTPQMFRAELMNTSGEIHLWLDSPGGDAFAGNAIYDMIREYQASGRGKVVAMVSLAASAASIIAMACDEIRISVVGTIMIHEPWSLTAGNEKELLATAQALANIREGQIDAYVKRTGLSREEVTDLMHGLDGHGTYMNANQSIMKGFADTIIDEDPTMRSALQSLKVASSISRNTEIMQKLVIDEAASRLAEAKLPRYDELELLSAQRELLETLARSY